MIEQAHGMEASMEPAGSVAGDRELKVSKGSDEAIAADQLRSFVERIENLNEEKAALAADSREIYSEAKGNGFDTKALRAVVRLRAMEKSDRDEQEAILELYAHALGL